MRHFFSGILFCFIFHFCVGQTCEIEFLRNHYPLETYSSDDEVRLTTRQKQNIILAGGATAYVGSLTGLYYLWYKDYPQSAFHFFNDNAEWLQMDKVAHATASYYIGYLGYTALRWAEVDEKKALWYGGFAGTIYLSVIEILDGFSKEWGFSWGDFAANVGGSLLFSTQQLIAGEQNIRLKYSFYPSTYAQYRPDLLGENLLQNTLKDYNGITCWLSVSPRLFLKNDTQFPDWLHISFGYSADGMTGAMSNPKVHNGIKLPEFERSRQFLLSADIDLTKLPIENKYFSAFANVFSFLKIPMPALEYHQKQGFVFHPLYF